MIGHFFLFIIANFVGYLVNADRRNPIGGILILAVPIGGVYFLGWWSLLTSLVGFVVGGYIFWNTKASRRDDETSRDDS